MPSVGFCLSITCLIFRLFKRLKLAPSFYEISTVHKVFFGIAGAIMAFKTMARNPAWHDSYTLYKTDIQQAPNSAKMRYHYALEIGKLALKETDPAKQVQIRKEAIAEDDLSLQVFSGNNDVYSHKGLMYYAIKDYKNALENYSKAIALGDKDAKTFSNMGTLYSEMGQPDKAIENYRKAVQYDPRFVDARRNLGCMLAISKDFKQAIIEFQEALKYDPQNPDILFFMGSAYKDMGDEKNAQLYLDQAYALKPSLKK
jgi:tetratricopeptide (TPR) repeat protein